MNPFKRHPKHEGNFFEDVFERQARSNGLLVLKNPLACVRTKTGFIPVKSDLDFKVFLNTGRVAYVDTKSFAEDHFTFSQLNPKQIERAVMYNDWKVPAGFVVWFRAINIVSFFSGSIIQRVGSGNRFLPEGGEILGKLERFTVQHVFATV